VENKEFTSAEKKAHMTRSLFKTMLMCFFDRKGDSSLGIHCTKTNGESQCYLGMLTRLRESVQRKRPELWPDKWILHHENAHDALRVCEFLAKKSITKMDHPPYSPDSALSKIKKMS
jgi:hypothetical protein